MPRPEHDPSRPVPSESAQDASTGAPGDATTELYRERLWPSVWVWIVCIGVAGGSLIVFAPINVPAGIAAFVILAGLLIFALIRSAATIVVTGSTVQVGRAQIERRYVGEVAGYRGEEARQQRGMDLNARSYQCIRGWVDPVVTIGITDEADPTPYWITSTRHPHRLVDALSSPVRH